MYTPSCKRERALRAVFVFEVNVVQIYMLKALLLSSAIDDKDRKSALIMRP